MEKKYLLIIICLFVFLMGVFLLGRRRDARRRWWLRRPFQSEEPTISPTPFLTATPEPTVLPSPTPAPSPTETTYYHSISESEFNSWLAQGVEQQPVERENPYTQATIDMQEGMAYLNMYFEKGQELNGEIFVTSDAKNLDLRNVSVSGAEGFESLFIDVASVLIKDGLDNLVSQIGQSIQLKKIEIKPGQMVVYYNL